MNNNIHVFKTARETGIAAGKAVEQKIVALQQKKNNIRIIFAAAPSQDYMLEYLAQSTTIQWHKITAFNMDEYIGLPTDAPQLFSKYLENRLFSKVPLKETHTIQPNNNYNAEITRFASMIDQSEIDIVCLGIGENGHLAFNDPPVADFDDMKTIKKVELDLICRQQQVNDGCFPTLDDVPKTALTLTIPTLLKANDLFCVVLGKHKSNAVKDAIQGEIGTYSPATILRTHPQCTYFFDAEAFQEIDKLSKV